MPEKRALPYETVFSTVYAGLRVNLCLAVATLPVVAAAAVTASRPAAWPLLAALSVLCGPALTGAFGAFEAMGDDPQRTGRAFWHAYRTGFTRSVATAAAGAAGVVVLAADLRLAVGTAFGPVTPLLVLLLALVVSVTTAVLAAGRPLPGRLVLAAAYLSLRRWYLTLANLAVLGTLLAVIAVRPVPGLLLLPAPALYVLWANARHTLAPLTAGPVTATPVPRAGTPV
ncbi:hypothetical protein ACWEQL_32960 [Kitasatospora sp. NPDC004240]